MTALIAGVRRADAIVIGSGIAGLSAALQCGSCLVVTKTRLGDGSSRLAQGGVAAALDTADSPAVHAADTMQVSAGLADPEVADLVTDAAADRIDWLLGLGAAFDRDDHGALLLSREAGHSAPRVVHAGGDATGAEIIRALTTEVRRRPHVTVLEQTLAVDLLRSGDRVCGVLVRNGYGDLEALIAPAVVLATGGIGRIYDATTNPVEVTGDGLAMARRAGVVLRDPEFVQFHPTALRAGGDPLPLLTEALRGDGATLLDHDGRRFMVGQHPDAELAPRDIVARAIWRALGSGPVYLDLRHLEDLARRFPTAFDAATSAGLDPAARPLPVTPAQHYHMGGVATDDAGRTSLTGLYACGEAAATGLHGANRLASNSLLEGMVFGRRIAADIVASPPGRFDPVSAVVCAEALSSPDPGHRADIAELRSVMGAKGGLVRSEPGLREGLAALEDLAVTLGNEPTGRNLVVAAETVLRAALGRRESRGGHYREDHPELDVARAAPTLVHPDPHPPAELALPTQLTR